MSGCGCGRITDAGVAHLAGLTTINRLTFSGDGITDAALAQLGNLRSLDTLTVEGNFTDDGLRLLYPLQGLHWLTIQSHTPLGIPAQERLVDALPNLTVYNQQPLGAGA